MYKADRKADFRTVPSRLGRRPSEHACETRPRSARHCAISRPSKPDHSRLVPVSRANLARCSAIAAT